VATMREKRPGVWEVRVFTGRDRNGRPTQVSKTVRGTKRDAQRVAAQLEGNAPTKAAGRTVADVLNAWLDVNDGVWSPASKRDYASRAAFIEASPIGSIAIARLDIADVERWHARLRRRGLAPATIRGRHAVLRAALAQAVRWDWVHTNVAAMARLRNPRASVRESMTADEVRAVIDTARAIDAAAGLALRLAAVGGLRRGEIAALRWDDFDPTTQQLRVDSSAIVVRNGERGEAVVVDAPTKTGDRRVLRLDETTAELFEAQRAERSAISPYVFSLTLDPPNPDRIGWWWRRARRTSRIDERWRLHDLRHWTATTAITNGHDVRTVAGRLGHANAAMTLRVYAHAVAAADEQVAVTLASALDANVD
jgi:integrase